MLQIVWSTKIEYYFGIEFNLVCTLNTFKYTFKKILELHKIFIKRQKKLLKNDENTPKFTEAES